MTTSTPEPIPVHLQPRAHIDKVEACRRDVETRLSGLKGRIDNDLPSFVSRSFTKNGVWAALALGVAAGLALAYRTKMRRR